MVPSYSQAYMQQKQFPRPLKKRVCTFYTYKYQNGYYKEDVVLDCLSSKQILRYHKILSSIDIPTNM